MDATYQIRMIRHNAAIKHAYSYKVSSTLFDEIEGRYNNTTNKTDETIRNYNIAKALYQQTIKIAEDAYNAEVLLADALAKGNVSLTIDTE